MRDLVSIIVPVYNTDENVLQSCVDSLCNQTYSAIEIVIVDDGSKAVTRNICDSLLKKDDRIKVFHKENGGVSKARNYGTSQACGSYIMYMDSDDLLSSFAIEEGMNAIHATGADFVFGAIKTIYSLNEEFEKSLTTTETKKVYTKDKIDIVRKAFMTLSVSEFGEIANKGYVNRGPVSRIIKAEIAKKVVFDEELVLGEDVEWNMRLLNMCDTVCYIPNVWYGYYITPDSSLRKYYGNRAELLERYHQKLYSANKEYFDKHMDEYGINMAVSFYRMLSCEYMSEKCPLTRKEKKQTIQALLSREPWCIMKRKDVFNKLSRRHKMLITACNLGAEFELLKLWAGIKKALSK